MIQRIQSIYLLVATLLSIGYLFADSVEQNDTNLSAMELMTDQNHLPLLILTVLSAIVSLVDIFMFKNRTLQMNLARLNLLIIIGIIGLMFYLEYAIDGDFTPLIGTFIPFLLIIFNVLAIRSINKDEKLVRSMDRLR